MDLWEQMQGVNAKEDGSIFLFTEIWDVSVIGNILKENNWKKCYLLLSKDADKFFSFYKLSQIDQTFINDIVVFNSIEQLTDFFLTNKEVELPDMFVGENIKREQRIVELIKRVRGEAKQAHCQEESCKLHFDDDFFNAEIREGFEVSEMMKRCWAAELELLVKIDEICSENGLTYYAEGGTLLGAIRHKGFIPWDDDIDLIMFREDYDKLIKIVNEKYGDKYYFSGLCQKKKGMRLIKKNSSAFGSIIENWDYMEYMDRFHGIPFGVCIDIVPLDYVVTDKDFLKVQRYIYSKLVYVRMYKEELIEDGEYEKLIAEIEELLDTKLSRGEELDEELFDYSVQVLSMGQEEESDKVAMPMYFTGEKEWIFERKWLQETIKVPFENIEVAIPKMYHEVLTQEYGEEYMTPVKEPALHEYPCYKKSLQDIQKRLSDMGYSGTIEEFCRNYRKIFYRLLLKQEIAEYKK